MYYAPMPLPILLLLVIAFICYLNKHRDKKGNLSNSFPKCLPETVPSRIRSVVEVHSDCTAEIIDVCSYTLVTNPITMRHIPGDPVELKMEDGAVAVYIDGSKITQLYYLPDSRIKQILKSGHKFDAYIFERDMEASNPNWMDFLKIIVFYKLDGIPPTKVTPVF